MRRFLASSTFEHAAIDTPPPPLKAMNEPPCNVPRISTLFIVTSVVNSSTPPTWLSRMMLSVMDTLGREAQAPQPSLHVIATPEPC